jgi:hypothetical protein
MKIAWKQIGKLALGIVSAVVPAVGQVEGAILALKGAHTGEEKQAAVLELVKGAVSATEQISDKDLLNDPEVEAATKAVIDTVVALQNILAKKGAA